MAKSSLGQMLEDLEAEIKSKSRDELLEMVLKDKKEILIIEKLKEMENCFNLFLQIGVKKYSEDLESFCTFAHSMENSIRDLKMLFFGNYRCSPFISDETIIRLLKKACFRFPGDRLSLSRIFIKEDKRI